MTKGKSNDGGSGFKRFLIFSGICLLVIAIVVGLVYWQWQNIASWSSQVTIGIAQLFGWGLVLVVLAILTFLVVIFSKPILLWRYWNKCIGVLILLAAIWGILALIPGSGYLEAVNLGGRIGQHIIGPSVAIGILIIIGLVIAGCFFTAPRGFSHLMANFFSWVFRRSGKKAEVPLPYAGNRTLGASQIGISHHRRRTGFENYGVSSL